MEIQKIFSNVEDPEENLYSVLMSEEELSLFSEIQKEFSSKAQKARRRKYDYQQGLNHGYLSSSKEDVLNAQSQAKIIGEKKTNELLDYSTKNTKTNKNFFSKDTTISVKNKKQADEIKRAEDLIRAGRSGSRLEAKFPTLTNSGKINPNHIINGRRSGEFGYGKIGGVSKYTIESALENGKLAQKKKLVEDLKKKKLTKKIALGTAAVIGTGIAAKKIYDKKKKKEEE